jgi:hypothetical protein
MIQLCDVAALVNGRIEFDLNQLVGLVLAADEESNNRTSITRDQLTRVVRRQVKAEGKAALRDDWLVGAYKQCNSYRKAAAWLSAESNQLVTKDQVWRAVQRAGSITAMHRGDDSKSVVRTVASRRRDTPIEKRESASDEREETYGPVLKEGPAAHVARAATPWRPTEG